MLQIKKNLCVGGGMQPLPFYPNKNQVTLHLRVNTQNEGVSGILEWASLQGHQLGTIICTNSIAYVSLSWAHHTEKVQ